MVTPHLSELRLTHLNLDVADLEVSERFYRDEFDLPVTRNAATLAIRTASFLLVFAKGSPSVGGSFISAFASIRRSPSMGGSSALGSAL